MVAEEDVGQTLLLHAVNLNKVVTFNVKTGSAVTGMENVNLNLRFSYHDFAGFWLLLVLLIGVLFVSIVFYFLRRLICCLKSGRGEGRLKVLLVYTKFTNSL